ncbi:hypothetical protein DVH24_019753 [Malus domestica]|uniref:Exonuclease domain-containing protein n=1 Tax=Malus domestica TaxID=3750 RepID=A0A498I456_MALDO|nr:hypothetical protein DVH24_019753 [Malus domestica]
MRISSSTLMCSQKLLSIITVSLRCVECLYSRYEVTGLIEEHLRNAMPYENVQEKILQILYSGKTKVLVGHNLDWGHCKLPSADENKFGQSLAQVPHTNISRAMMRLYKRFSALDHEREGIGHQLLLESFEALKTTKLEEMVVNDLYEISTPKYRCWRLDLVQT